MVEISRVCCANSMGEAEKTINLDCERWGRGKHVSNPVMEAVMITEETYKVSD